MSNPMEQFTIKPIIPIEVGGVDISFTNSSLFMVLAVVVSTLVFVGVEGLKYFSFIFTVFLFVAFGNLLGLFPYAFTFTSHLAAVGGLSVIALLFNICIGIRKKKWGYLRTFLPKGIPAALAPLIVPIEMISFLSKPFSLTVRLVANMTVGHIMLKIIAGFIVALGIGGIVPLAFDGCIIVFEIFIALLQAFIYTVLSCIYLGDALHSH